MISRFNDAMEEASEEEEIGKTMNMTFIPSREISSHLIEDPLYTNEKKRICVF